MDTKYYGVPFGALGDRNAVPIPVQVDGSVSYTQGYGPDYSLDPETDPDSLLLTRAQFNELLYQVTAAVGALQQDFPEWISATDNGGTPYPYNQGAVVRYVTGGDHLWQSLVDGNVATPGSDVTKWVIFLSQYATVAALATETGARIAADALLAPLNSPLFIGTPRGPTQNPGDVSAALANTAFVAGAVQSETNRAMAVEATKAPINNPNFAGPAYINSQVIATENYADSAVAVERNRALNAESLLAPLLSPGFSGSPTVPTPPGGDSSALIPNTSWVQGLFAVFVSLLQNLNISGGSGWYQIGTFIIQWDTFTCTNVSQSFSFPRSFPSACLKLVCVEGEANDPTWGIGNPTLMAPGGTPSPSGGEIYALIWNPGAHGWQGADGSRPTTCSYIAIGY